MPHELSPILALAVGNTRARFGLFVDREMRESASALADDAPMVAKDVARLLENVHDARVVLSSVNPPAARAIAEALRREGGAEVLEIGEDVAIPLRHALDDASTLGQDRALCALGAFARSEQACVVVDAGTAVTVDFVDGEGVFQGGVIAPGLGMMLRALHEHTAALPELRFELPDPKRGPFGKDTRHAMLLGVQSAVRGLVRDTVERFAETYEAYPQIVATGGDAHLLFENDDLVEHVVPDLQLLGIIEACRAEAEAD